MARHLAFLLATVCMTSFTHAGPATNHETWSRRFPQASLVSLLPDRLGHVAAVMSTTSSNVVVLLSSNGATLASATIPTTTNLPSPVQAAAADFAGNIYITGQANPPTAYLSTLKLKPNLAGIAWTNTCLITNPFSPGRLAIVREMVCDDSGNAYSIGRFSQYVGDIDQFVLSVGAEGARWFDGFNSDSDDDFDKGIGIVKAGDGTLFVAGHSDHYFPSGSSVLARRFTPGGALLWASNYLSTPNGNSYTFSETPADAVLDSGYHLIVAGGRIEGFDRGYLTMKIDSTGHVIWRALLYHPHDIFAATGVAVDSEDNIIVTGPVGTVKYAPSGELIWYSPEVGTSVRVTANDCVVLSCSVREGNSPFVVTTTKLLADGEVAWRARYNGIPGGDHVFKNMFVDRDGAIYVGLDAGNTEATILKYQEPPTLKMKVINPSQLKLSWSASDTNTVVTSATIVNATSWNPVTNPPVLNGDEWNVSLPLTDTQRFFRLEQR